MTESLMQYVERRGEEIARAADYDEDTAEGLLDPPEGMEPATYAMVRRATFRACRRAHGFEAPFSDRRAWI